MGQRNVRCSFIEETNLIQVRLRRYIRDGGECNDITNHGYHDASTILPGAKEESEEDVNTNVHPGEIRGGIAYDDPRWPSQCSCGFKFDDSAQRQYFPEHLWRVQGTDTLVTLRNALPGSMWYASWYKDVPQWCGPDGKALFVKLPNGWDWHIDSRASNCDSPCAHCGRPYHAHDQKTCSNPGDPDKPYTKGSYVDGRPHQCWVRHGTPPNVTVDKQGTTCGAGAGSIVGGNWHGFLRSGNLEEC